MCLAFDELFGLKTVLSSSASEFKLSAEELAASALGPVWKEFLERMAAAPDTRLTPAYDLTLAYAVANATLPHFTALDPADSKTVTANRVSLVSMMRKGGPTPFTPESAVEDMGVAGIGFGGKLRRIQEPGVGAWCTACPSHAHVVCIVA